jgi:DNA-directed RNA polymerase II subunit RPB2
MEVARHVFNSYFSDNPNVLVRHHLDSYADLLNFKIPNFVAGLNPMKLELGDGRKIHIYIGGKENDHIEYLPPVDQFNNAILPHQCRLDDLTYTLTIKAKFDVEYTIGNEVTKTSFPNVTLAKIPLMTKSPLCYLSNMTSDELYQSGECKFELGGYFIIGGAEKVLLTQERLGNNLFYASKRVRKPEQSDERTLYEREAKSRLDRVTREDKYEYIANVKSISEDGTRGPYSHFLVIPSKNVRPDDPKELSKNPDLSVFSTKRVAMITLHEFVQPVPLISIFYALGVTNDKDIYDIILAGIEENERSRYDELFMELIFSHENLLRKEMATYEDQNEDPNMLLLYRYVKSRTKAGVYVNLYNNVFPHCEPREGESTASYYRRKAYLLGLLTRMAMEVALGIKNNTDREHYRFKRLDVSGDLMFQEFRRIYKDVMKSMRTALDSRIHYQKASYEGNKLSDLIQVENINSYWRGINFLIEFEKSFKGKWGGKDGIAQQLNRAAYLGSIAHLRRVNVEIDRALKVVEVRRIHGTTWGLMCPVDNPDGRNVGLVKSMTIMCAVSTATPSKVLYDMISKVKYFKPIHLIHPSIWDIRWTKVFLNSDLIGVLYGNTNEFHEQLLSARREGVLNKFVSLCWNRLDNEYIINTDAGRASRPVYREGMTLEKINKMKDWNQLIKYGLDYIDCQEVESLRLSMEPFSPENLSEIHGTVIFSASGSVTPFSDHNASTRNTFICQQSKQACSWYNTAFNKRFDTNSSWLNNASRPICQTWTNNHVLGKDGCMPYGETPIVAIGIYSGYNQDDSIIVNKQSVERGLFGITYYHSYKVLEEIVDSLSKQHSEIANIATDPRFRETVSRQADADYSKLGPDGIIMKGSAVTDKTVLVGMVVPKLDSKGQIVSYVDKSVLPNRGQLGMIDDVYIYNSASSGLRCVKIRISENRKITLGDKLGSRHGQKGVCGMLLDECDMPFTKDGVRPDIIISPAAFPSRMTIGQLVESMVTKLGIHLGCLIDSTAFSTQNRIFEFKDLLTKSGYHPYGHEVMYNGQTGEMMEAEIFMGPTHYIRMKQMVEDKINYRSTGPRRQLTRQPVEGRQQGGGLKIGEMDRDCLISHGISKFWNESMMERSDKTELLFQPDLGKFDANMEFPYTRMPVPYATHLLMNEVQSMHISMNLLTDNE